MARLVFQELAMRPCRAAVNVTALLLTTRALAACGGGGGSSSLPAAADGKGSGIGESTRNRFQEPWHAHHLAAGARRCGRRGRAAPAHRIVIERSRFLAAVSSHTVT
jgi:hypothetical protein